MTTLGISFTNFGPYHVARLRALADRLAGQGGRLIAYETAGTERTYPWQPARGAQPFEWTTLFPDQVLETIPRASCARAIDHALERDQPDAMAIVGYWRPESMAALRWARRRAKPTILMSETQAIDHPRVWWKESVKARRVRQFSAALVGGPRHRDYLVQLGMAREQIALGYNAVDNTAFARWADEARRSFEGRSEMPRAPYFLAVSRFVPEKNLVLLVRAYARYRELARDGLPWDLVICGGGPAAHEVEDAVNSLALTSSVHRPGFLQANALARWYAYASAFVHPSLMEPWGLVANEAAACGLPLLLSNLAGCAETLVPDPAGTSGYRFDPRDLDEIADSLLWVAGLPESERAAMGERARNIVAEWGPERFAAGTLDALEHARTSPSLRKRSRNAVSSC